MSAQKAARFVLVSLVVLLAVPAAGVQAATRMPIGFFDDSSFRFSAARAENLAGAAAAGASVIHTTANWSMIAPTRPSTPSNGDDPAYRLADLDELVFSSANQGLRVMINVTGTPEVGQRQQDTEPPADAPLRPDDVHQDARDAVQRPLGSRHGRALVGLERAEHRALPGAAVLGQEDRRAGELREALQGGVRGHQGGQRAREGRDRRDVGAWPRQAARGRQRQRRAAARSRSCSAR